jgi:hypothetical protein
VYYLVLAALLFFLSSVSSFFTPLPPARACPASVPVGKKEAEEEETMGEGEEEGEGGREGGREGRGKGPLPQSLPVVVVGSED